MAWPLEAAAFALFAPLKPLDAPDRASRSPEPCSFGHVHAAPKDQFRMVETPNLHETPSPSSLDIACYEGGISTSRSHNWSAADQVLHKLVQLDRAGLSRREIIALLPGPKA
jgi:hypothetical protein